MKSKNFCTRGWPIIATTSSVLTDIVGPGERQVLLRQTGDGRERVGDLAEPEVSLADERVAHTEHVLVLQHEVHQAIRYTSLLGR